MGNTCFKPDGSPRDTSQHSRKCEEQVVKVTELMTTDQDTVAVVKTNPDELAGKIECKQVLQEPAPVEPNSSLNENQLSIGMESSAPSKKRTDKSVKDVYRIGKNIGTGGFSVVKLATDKETMAEYACKVMNLPAIGEQVGENENTREDIFKEIDILCGLQHPNIIYLKEYFEEKNRVYLITELLTGGELLEAVLQRGTYNEREASHIFAEVLRGIEYLHSKKVVHRDLKLENLLLTQAGDITHVKIADFGLAKMNVEAMSTICGTPQYVAPEIIQGTKGLVYTAACDMWSAGVVLFILLGGYPPFWSENEPQLFEIIRKGKYSFDDPVWRNVSDSAKDLIAKLLTIDPKQRPTATQALAHPWFKNVSAAPLTGTREKLKKYREGTSAKM